MLRSRAQAIQTESAQTVADNTTAILEALGRIEDKLDEVLDGQAPKTANAAPRAAVGESIKPKDEPKPAATRPADKK